MSDEGGRAAGARLRLGLIGAPLAFAAVWAAPFGLEPPAHRLAAVLAAVVVLWVSEAIPMAMTAFLGVATAVVLRVAPVTEAFAPFADPLVFLFIGTFMLAQAIFFHGLDRRFAFTILALPGVGGHPGRVLAAYAAATCAISMWISNTATVAMMFPIGLSLLGVLEQHAGRARLAAYGTALLLSTSFAAYLAREIETAILFFESRIELNRVNFDKAPDQEGLVLIRLDYTVRTTNTRTNLVYPFYVNQATNA